MDRNYSQELLDAIQRADRTGAGAIVEAWAVGRDFKSVVSELLTPTLETFGRLWSGDSNSVSLATGYVASKVAEDVLSKLLLESSTGGAPAAPAKGPVLLGNIEEDFHPLGRKMVVAFLRADGWEVHDLGVDVPAEHFVDRAEETGARIIGASAMMYSTAKNVAKLREELDRRGHTGRIQLAVGGAVFKLRPELVTTFGGDGTASSAVEAPALFDRLWQRALTADSVPREVRS